VRKTMRRRILSFELFGNVYSFIGFIYSLGNIISDVVIFERKRYSLDKNHITDIGAVALGEALKNNDTLYNLGYVFIFLVILDAKIER
jgi:hypothetical protein